MSLGSKAIMAQQDTTDGIGFKEVRLLKDQTLGIGSYGSVCKALCDDLLCAGKILHPTLFDASIHWQISQHRAHRLPIRRFEAECAFLKAIRHPNIIQYIGVYQDPETGLPVLLMELMDESLTHFLESSDVPLLCHTQVNFSLDVAQALSFLHLNRIVHRDLSSNNILLIGKCRAKLTDFGMAKLVNIQATGCSNTICPGTNAYMPPEAVDDQAKYTEKGDVFSFGVNIIQILTKRFPKPADRHKTIQIDHPQFPSGNINILCSEVERRHNHISSIDQTHPLLPIALSCLEDQVERRATARELCQQLVSLKDVPRYVESETASREPSRQITGLQRQLRLQEHQYEQQAQTCQQQMQELRCELTATRSQVQNQGQLHRRIADLRQQLNTRTRPQLVPHHQSTATASSTDNHPAQSLSAETIKLTWVRGVDAPCKMHRSTDTVVDGNTVYFNLGASREVYEFDSNADIWSRLPDCPIELTTLAIVNGLLTTIGGWSKTESVSQLFSFTGEGTCKRWEEVYPPMPTKRWGVSAVSAGAALIVVGGERGDVLQTVEIFDTNAKFWSTAADLPDPIYESSATICGDRMYVLGGCRESLYYTPSKKVYTCTLSSLLISSHQVTLETPLTALQRDQQDLVWSTAADLPVYRATCVAIDEKLLAVGGEESNPVTAVRMYNRTSNSWQIISHLSTPRSWCFAAVLSDWRIMVVGGYTSTQVSSATSTIEYAIVNS